MSIPVLSPIPLPPSTTDLVNFNARTDAFLAALPQFQQQLNAVIAALNPLVPGLPGLGEIVKQLEAIRLVGENIASVNAVGTNIQSVNAVATTVYSGALQKVADALQSIIALASVAIELAELAAHINDFSELAERTQAIMQAVEQLQSVVTAADNIVELVALGANMDAVIAVYENLDVVKKALEASITALQASRTAVEAKVAAEAARDAAKNFAESASGVTGLPIGVENDAPPVWSMALKKYVAGRRVALAENGVAGLVTADATTLVVERGIMRVKPMISASVIPNALALRDPDGRLTGDVTGKADPRTHAASHGVGGPDAVTPAALGINLSVIAAPGTVPVRNGQGKIEGALQTPPVPAIHAASHAVGGPDAVTPASLGIRLSIPGAADTVPLRNSQGKIEGQMATPQPPSTHAASHSQSGTDPVTLEALGVVISGAGPSGTAARLWIQYF